jgi:hypothetical protein
MTADHDEYPKRTAAGLVWACCESRIGQPCRHKSQGEFAVALANGNVIWTDTYADNPAGSSYVRVTGPDGTELGYWDSAEWRDDPQLVMGAILGAAGNGASAP